MNEAPTAGPSSGSSRSAAATPPPIVEIVGVTKSFGETRALRGVTFTAYPGEIHAVVGENGSGKSTLAKVLSGIARPDSGTVVVAGSDVTDPRAARRLGVATVFQEVLVAEGMTVADNVFMGVQGPWRAHVTRSDKRARTRALLEELTEQPVDPDELVDHLSLATRQWITIARAIVRQPRVVVFDESTAALDLDGASRLYREMQRLRDEGACVLVVTHRIAELTSFADRATVLRDGVDVGVVEGADITLDRLLTLMSGVEVAERTSSRTPEHRRDAAAAGPVLTVRGLAPAGASATSDLTLRRGEVIGLAGLEGQGQAEFVQAVCGVVAASQGTVEVDVDGTSRRVSNLAEAAEHRISYISGDRRKEGIFSNLSILENFGLPLYRSTRRGGVIDRRRVAAMFRTQSDRLALRAGSSHDPISSLSGGNQQKVLIGRVLAQDPRVVALNDPARGVDIRTKRELYEQLEMLALNGTAVIYLSTEIDELVGLCDRVAVFRDGAIFGWLDGDRASSDRILAAMFGHLETDFDVEDALAATP